MNMHLSREYFWEKFAHVALVIFLGRLLSVFRASFASVEEENLWNLILVKLPLIDCYLVVGWFCFKKRQALIK